MSEAEQTATKHCKNCKRDIAESNYVIHEVHCRRNIVLCEHCNEPVPRVDLETHVKDVHAPINCDLCGSAVERDRTQQHKNEECSRRPCPCQYCELIFTAQNHAEHVEYCGSRTEPCGLCGRFVRLRDAKVHEESNCSLPPTAAVMPAVSSSNDDFACDVGMEAYHLAQLDQQLCRDVASNVLWTSNPRADHSCSGQFSRPAPSSVGRSFQSRGFVKRNRPGYFVDRQDGTRAAAAKNNEYIGRRPKVMNGPQRGNSASAHNNDDTECNLLPCEFCSSTFPSDVLLQHQVFCGHQDLSNVDPPDYGVNLLHDDEDRTPHELDHTSPVNGTSLPWSLDDISGENGDVLLPCEFCEALLPGSQLAFHQSNCEVARLFGATTPLVPSAAPPLPPRLARLSRRQSPWNEDSPSSTTRACRHQGPPVHPHHRRSSDDRAVSQEFDDIPPPAQNTGHQRRNIGSRPGMHSRPRMHAAAAATRPQEQPAMPSKSGSERAEPQSEPHQTRRNVRASAGVQAGRHATCGGPPPRRLPPRFTNQPSAMSTAGCHGHHSSQISPQPAPGYVPSSSASSDTAVSHADTHVFQDTQPSVRSPPAAASMTNNTTRYPHNRPPRMSVSRNTATNYHHSTEQNHESTGHSMSNYSRSRRPTKTNNRDNDSTQAHRRATGGNQ